MECFACAQICPNKALKVNEKAECVRLKGFRPFEIDSSNCNDCGLCTNVCLMGDTAKAMNNCNFCIICKSKPNCLIYKKDRINIKNFILSIIRVTLVIPRYKLIKKDLTTFPH